MGGVMMTAMDIISAKVIITARIDLSTADWKDTGMRESTVAGTGYTIMIVILAMMK
jgi:hypothetical protein